MFCFFVNILFGKNIFVQQSVKVNERLIKQKVNECIRIKFNQRGTFFLIM